jgi:hypothetical protein
MPTRCSAMALTDTMRISFRAVSTCAFTFTWRPLIPLSASGLLTIQILLSLSAVKVLPSLPTLPGMLILSGLSPAWETRQEDHHWNP